MSDHADLNPTENPPLDETNEDDPMPDPNEPGISHSERDRRRAEVDKRNKQAR